MSLSIMLENVMVLPAWAVHVLWRILIGMFAPMLHLKLISFIPLTWTPYGITLAAAGLLTTIPTLAARKGRLQT